MIVSEMRYKGYSWKHNPKTLKVSAKDGVWEQAVFRNKSIVQKTGKRARVVTGTGQLFGDDCIRQYGELLKLQSKGGSGILSLPDTLPFYAFFKSLELACDPTPESVTYSFEFVEDLSGPSYTDNPLYHTVVQGEDLWDISYKYGVSIEKLVELNPQISRVDELTAGGTVKIC